MAPRRPKNADVRPREYLNAEEVERLTAAAKKVTRRQTHRDAREGHSTRAIREWLGHGSIRHTTCYTELTAKWFKSL